MAGNSPQRVYRAPCPGCGAPVEFRSAQSTHAVCGYCQSTVVRDGEVLKRLGKMAELFDDHSLLQLGSAGLFDKQPFTLVGRLQYRYGEGTWTEWQVWFDDGRIGTLSEDNGAYVLSFPQDNQRALPAAEQFQVGATTTINGQPWGVASNQQVSLVSAQGELPKLPPIGQPFALVELRSQGDEGRVLSIDYGMSPPAVSVGRAILLEDLALTGLKDESAKDEKGRQFACPHCGSPVEVKLEGTKSITCGACNSLIDLSAGMGGEMAHAVQEEPVKAQIPLGTVGQLQGVHWQVVGFQHRSGHEDGDDEHFGWSEYLLYNAKRGFAFLVDAEDGWSLVRPATGAPKVAADGKTANLSGKTYKLEWEYEAETSYVAGEFYWRVQRGQKTRNRDYSSGRDLLSQETSANETTWSAGSKIEAEAVAKAFGLADKADLFKRLDAAPLSSAKSSAIRMVVIVLVLIVILLIVLTRCARCDPAVENCSSSSSSSGTYRSSGGSFGGSSSGGSHK